MLGRLSTNTEVVQYLCTRDMSTSQTLMIKECISKNLLCRHHNQSHQMAKDSGISRITTMHFMVRILVNLCHHEIFVGLQFTLLIDIRQPKSELYSSKNCLVQKSHYSLTFPYCVKNRWFMHKDTMLQYLQKVKYNLRHRVCLFVWLPSWRGLIVH